MVGQGTLKLLENALVALKRDTIVNGIISINPRLDEEILSLKSGPLHGVPIIVKDCIATKNWVTSCGSKQMERNTPDVRFFITDLSLTPI
jgi:Asp-tRNA(Asn)/Glu-tRNA(Gln) amidotransferase A subunit family amidase